MNWFQVGQRVMCIDDFFDVANLPDFETMLPNRPVKARVYTIRWIGILSNDVCVRLSELVNPEWRYPDGILEPGFNAKRFRPLKKTKTGAEMLEEMIAPHRKQLERVE